MSLTASGMLLHTAMGEDVGEAGAIQGHRLRSATVDLAAKRQGHPKQVRVDSDRGQDRTLKRMTPV